MARNGSRQVKILGMLLAVLVAAVAVQSGYMLRMNNLIADMDKKLATQEEAAIAPDSAAATAAPVAQTPSPAAPPQPQAQLSIAPAQAPSPIPQSSGTVAPAQGQASSTAPIGPTMWDPYEEMRRMDAFIDHMMQSRFTHMAAGPGFGLMGAQAAAPAFDVSEEADRYVIRFPIEGEPNVRVEVKHNVVSISGKEDKTVEQKNKDGHVVRREHRMGQFERSFPLPQAIDAAKMQTKRENGIYTIVLPKATVHTN